MQTYFRLNPKGQHISLEFWSTIFIQENDIENVACKMETIYPRPQSACLST